MDSCVFCNIRDGHAPAKFMTSHPDWFAIEPLNPHAPGHTLFIPKSHVTHAGQSPRIAGSLFEAAAMYASNFPAFNLLTSAGEAATQTVGHLHIHVIPRGPDDGLPADWPWMRPEKSGDHPHAQAVDAYLRNGGITPENLRYAATHESLSRHWIFDLLMGLADTLEEADK